jgi:hypothetical protein
MWSDLPECADTFGLDDYGSFGPGHHLLLQPVGLTNYTESGKPFHIVAMGPHRIAEVPDLYENALNILQVVLLRPPARVTNGASYSTLHCMRVQTKKEEVSAGSAGDEADKGEGDDSGNNTNGDGGNGTNTAAGNVGSRNVATGLWDLLHLTAATGSLSYRLRRETGGYLRQLSHRPATRLQTRRGVLSQVPPTW